MEFVKLDISKLIQLYEGGASARSLARMFNTSSLTIRNKLKKAGITLHTQSTYITNKHRIESYPGSELTEELLQQLWGTMSMSAISRQTGATPERIKRMAHRLKLPRVEIKPKNLINPWWDNEKWLREHYEEKGYSLNKLRETTGASDRTIQARLRQYSIKKRSLQESITLWNHTDESKEIRSKASKAAYKKTKHKLNEGRQRYLQSLPSCPYKDKTWLENEHKSKNASQIAKEQNVHPVTIKYWLIKFDTYDASKLRRWSDEMRLVAKHNSIKLWEDNYDKLKTRTKEQRQRIAESLSAYYQDNQSSEKIHIWKQRISKSVRKLWANAEYRQKNSKFTTRGRAIHYDPLKSLTTRITFRSHLECAYAIYLDLDDEIKFWTYETTTMPYISNGLQRTYVVDFTVYPLKGSMYHVEVKPHKLQLIEPKYSEARKILLWRFSTLAEIHLASQLFKEGYRRDAIEFHNSWYGSRYTAWSKKAEIDPPGEWKLQRTKRFGAYYTHLCVTTESG